MRLKLKLLTLIALAVTSWLGVNAQNATAQQDLLKGINVTHDKAWYEQEQFDYKWVERSTGIEKTSKLTDRATDPDQIIALLTKVYTDRNIPGIHFAGYGDTNGSNLNQRTRPVYYGGIAGGWNIAGTADLYTDYNTYIPYEEGYTVLLVAVKSTWQKRWDDKKENIEDPLYFDAQDRDALRTYIDGSIQYVQLLTDGMRLNENSTDPNYPAGTLFVLGDGAGLDRLCFLSKGQARDSYHGDRADAQILAPFGRMFEQFSPTNGQTDDASSDVADFYKKLQQGEEFPIQHDCSSVIDVEHYFSMSGKRGSDPKNVTGLQFFIPDKRLAYWENNAKFWVFYTSTEDGEYYQQISDQVDGRIMNYDRGLYKLSNSSGVYMYYDGWFNGPLYKYNSDGSVLFAQNWTRYFDGFSDNAHNGGYAEFSQYNQEYGPKTSWYRIDLTATPVYVGKGEYKEHTWKIDLSWETTMKKLTAEDLEQEFWIYEVKPDGSKVLIGGEGDDDGNPIYGKGVKQTTWTIEDNSDALTVEQYQSGRKLTYIVIGKPIAATYPPIQCYEPADAIIPGYDKHERLSLQIGTDYYSKYYPNGDNDPLGNEYNQYCNSVKIENGIGNSIYQNYLTNGTSIEVYRTYNDNGNPNTIKFANLKFGDWEATPVAFEGQQRYRIPYTISYEGQKGDIPFTDKTQATSGYLYTENAESQPAENAVYFGKDGLELLDCFRGYTANNDHPDKYTYYVKFTAAIEFEIDNDGNKSKEVNSNNEDIPVFKSNYSLYNNGYVLDQVVNDNKNDVSTLLPAHITFNQDGTIATDLNKINVTLDNNAMNLIYRYELYRDPKMGLDKAKKIAYAQSTGNGQYEVNQLAEKSSDMQTVGNTEPTAYDFIDHNALESAGSYGYVPVIMVKPNDENREDYNTYGADIKRVGIPKLDLTADDPKRSTYTWTKDEATYAYYLQTMTATATLPDDNKYTNIGWRNWRVLDVADVDAIIGEEYDITRNMNGGFLFDEYMQQDAKQNPYDVGENTYNWGEQTKHDGTKIELNEKRGLFGARTPLDNVNVDYIVRFYYSVNNTKSKAPRAEAETLTSENGQFYVADYKITKTLTSDIITGVSSVNPDREVSGVMYYNAMGLPSVTPWQGVNIVVTRYTDGTTSTTKVIK